MSGFRKALDRHRITLDDSSPTIKQAVGKGNGHEPKPRHRRIQSQKEFTGAVTKGSNKDKMCGTAPSYLPVRKVTTSDCESGEDECAIIAPAKKVSRPQTDFRASYSQYTDCSKPQPDRQRGRA